jgi:hypothetical protein
VERAGGIANNLPMLGSNASQLMKNLQQLIASNPEYLTSGIPTHLIQQMWNKEPAPSAATTTTTAGIGSLPANRMIQTKVINRNVIDVCSFIIFYYFSLYLERFLGEKY